MGAHLVRRYWGKPEPDPITMPASPVGEQFQERVMVASSEQMNMAKLPLPQRDYCTHHLIKLMMKCKRDMWPKIFTCKDERHEWEYCQHLDYVQYVREQRPLVRKARQKQMEE